MRLLFLKGGCLLGVATALLLFAGCPSAVPPGSGKGSGAKDAAEKPGADLKENAEDVAALKGNGATLGMDSAGHVEKVKLNQDSGGDKDLAHLKGLPFVRDLGADVRGVTDAGLAFLENHPSLRAIKLERSAVTDAGMPHLQKLPKLEDLDLRRTGITAA